MSLFSPRFCYIALPENSSLAQVRAQGTEWGLSMAVELEEADVALVVPDMASPWSHSLLDLREKLPPELAIVLLVPENASEADRQRAYSAGAELVRELPLTEATARELLAFAHGIQRRRLAKGNTSDLRELNDELIATYAKLEEQSRMIARVQKSFLPRRLPETFPWSFGAAERRAQPDRPGGLVWDVRRLGKETIVFFLADAGTSGTLATGIIALAARWAVAIHQGVDRAPHEVLEEVNASLIGLAIDPAPLVGLTYGVIDLATGVVQVARAGTPPVVELCTNGETQLWIAPGPMLGAFDASFVTKRETILRGGKLVLASVGSVELLQVAAEAAKALPAQALADQVAEQLAPHYDDRVILTVARTE